MTEQTTKGIVLLGAILGGLSIHNYIPQITSIAADLYTTTNSAQITIPAFLFSFAVSQLFYGIVSDYFGRRTLYFHGLCIFVIGCIICMLADSILWFILGRFVQGFGAGCTLVLGLAVFKDIFKPDRLFYYYSQFAICFILAFLAAPFLGAFLVHFLKWQYTFALLAIYGIALMLGVWFFLPETNKEPIREKRLNATVHAYMHLLKDRCFLGYTLITCLAFCVPLIMYSMVPFILVSRSLFDMSSFPLLNLFAIVCYSVGGIISNYSVKHIGLNATLSLGILLWICMPAVGLLLASFERFDLISVLVPAGLILFSIGAVFVSALTASLSSQEHWTGNASAILGFLLFSVGAVSDVFSTWFDEHTQIPMLGFVLGLGILGLLVFWLVVPGNLRVKKLK